MIPSAGVAAAAAGTEAMVLPSSSQSKLLAAAAGQEGAADSTEMNDGMILITKNASFCIELKHKLDDSVGRSFCVSAYSIKEGSSILMRLCDCDNAKQRWYLDEYRQIRLAREPDFCIVWYDGRQLKLSSNCKGPRNPSKKEYPFVITSNSVIAQKPAVTTYLGTKEKHHFGPMNLFHMASGNPSLVKFSLRDIEYDISQPSMEPSNQPSVCVNEAGWVVGGSSAYKGLSCWTIESQSQDQDWCNEIMFFPDSDNFGKTIDEACCICGGSTYKTTHPSLSPGFTPTMASQEPTFNPSAQPSECRDEDDWFFDAQERLGCDAISQNPDLFCLMLSTIEYLNKNSMLACCVCGGGRHTSIEPSSMPTSRPSPFPTSGPTSSSSPTLSITMIPSVFPTVSSVPSDYPSMETESRYDGENCNYDAECKNPVSQCVEKECLPVVSLFRHSPLSYPITISNIQVSLLPCLHNS